MASAVIASQNESSWAHMGKIPYSSRHLNPNPNPSPKKKPKHFHNASGNGVAGRYQNGDSPAVTQAASDDAYSFNQTSTSRHAVNFGRYLTLNLASYTKSELFELRKRLSAELEQVRDLQNRIDFGQFSHTGNPRSHAKFKKSSVNERPIAAFGLIPDRASVDRDALLKHCRQIVAKLLKHKIAYVFKAPVDAVALGLHDYHSIVKHPMDLGTVKANLAKNFYPTPVEFAADVRLTFNNALLYNPKHDPVNGWAELLLARFEELFRPIQEKIDSCTNQHTEMEIGFQESRVNEHIQYQRNQVTQGNSWSNHNQQSASPLRGKKMKPKASPVQVERIQMPLQTHSSASTSSNPLPPVSNNQPRQDQIPSPARALESIEPVKDSKLGRGAVSVKQPKPKAKDRNKREMSMEEKQKLGNGLQDLPQEKMPQLLQIIRKRNDQMAQDGDEIELDIEALDTETLWELDRFVTNWKKFLSKSKRQSQMNNDSATDIAAPSTPIADADMGLVSDKNEDSVKKSKDDDDEDVDIDDDMPATTFPPVEIEKDEGAGVAGGDGQEQDQHDRGNASSSSSGSGSSSSDSSSSDSDSGSSSDSDSDADDAQS